MTTWTQRHNTCAEFRFIQSLPKDDRATMMEFYKGATREEKQVIAQYSLDRELEVALVRHRKKVYEDDYRYELGVGEFLVLDKKSRDEWIETVRSFHDVARGAISPLERQGVTRKLKAILRDQELDYDRILSGQRDPDENLPLEQRAMIALAQSVTSNSARVIRHKVMVTVSQPDKSGIRENYEWKYASWEDRIFVPIATLARRLGISRDRAGRIYFGKPGSGLGYERARTRINTDFFSGVIVKPGSEEFEQLRRDLSTWQSSGSV